MKGFIGGIPVALLAVAAQAKFVRQPTAFKRRLANQLHSKSKVSTLRLVAPPSVALLAMMAIVASLALILPMSRPTLR